MSMPALALISSDSSLYQQVTVALRGTSWSVEWLAPGSAEDGVLQSDDLQVFMPVLRVTGFDTPVARSADSLYVPDNDRILGAILFENTMDREVEGQSTAGYLWNVKNVAPFLKVDNGLADEENGVQLMKPIPELAALLAAPGLASVPAVARAWPQSRASR